MVVVISITAIATTGASAIAVTERGSVVGPVGATVAIVVAATAADYKSAGRLGR